jgi:hypothetical protein
VTGLPIRTATALVRGLASRAVTEVIHSLELVTNRVTNSADAPISSTFNFDQRHLRRYAVFDFLASAAVLLVSQQSHTQVSSSLLEKRG